MTSSPGSDPSLPDIAAIRAAAGRIASEAVLTPLLESPAVNARLGGRLLIKAEPLQRTGSFKFRGAYNTLAQFSPTQRGKGVVTWSSGNHAQGVAAAAQALGIPALIVMPADAPAIKIANTRGYGAEIVLYDRIKESREEIGARIAAERGATIVAPYDEPQ
ncbi:MAG TPA: pyridoxal-phosphate dependent enzyme, partial [Stellaceae bacterium]|nr:pyridoxal-phosphate dependent enzyme [Stellaceae bacterium]